MSIQTSSIQPLPTHDKHSSGARMHPVADGYIAWRLFKHALHRTVGLPTDAPFLATLFAIGVLLQAFLRLAAPVLKAFRPKSPSLASAIMAGSVIREMPGSIAGERARSKPGTGALILFSLAAAGHPGRIVTRIFRGPARSLAAVVAVVRRYGV